MREIKCRAWGHLPDDDTYKMFFDIYLYPFNGSLMPSNGEFTNPICDHELMQWTGLKDKNGKEIYESDVLSCKWPQSFQFHDSDMFTVVWDNAYSRWGFSNKDAFDDYHMDRFEVIGNIHENPDLL